MMISYMHEPNTFHLSKNVAELTRGLQTDTDNFAKVIIYFVELVMELFVILTNALTKWMSETCIIFLLAQRLN